MAKVKLNPALEAIQGKVGDLVFKRWEGDEIVSRMPDRTGIVPSANQLAQMAKFRLAALYGKAVLADPDARLHFTPFSRAGSRVRDSKSARSGVPAAGSAIAPQRGNTISPGQRSGRPAPWETVPSGLLSLFLFRAVAGAKQEKGKIHYYSPYPGRRSALPWASVLLSFPDANSARPQPYGRTGRNKSTITSKKSRHPHLTPHENQEEQMPARAAGSHRALSAQTGTNERARCPEHPPMVVVRTERRSWMALAITGFGALLLRYFKTVRERGQTVRRAKT